MKIFRLAAFLLPENRKLESQLEVFRRAIDDGGRRLENVLILDGNVCENVSLVSGSDITIYHGLNRVLRGWFITRAQGSSPSLYEVSRDSETLILHAGNTGTVDIWVF